MDEEKKSFKRGGKTVTGLALGEKKVRCVCCSRQVEEG